MERLVERLYDRPGIHSYLACAEPSWAKAVPENQLLGLLNLSCLLYERIYLSDVHLGDNRNFLDSFRRRRQGGLYSRLQALAGSGLVRFLLRDVSFRPQAETSATRAITCDSFSDVYRSWIVQDPRAAWIYPDTSDERAQYFRDLDSWALKAVERYDYQAVKLDFMEEIRSACRFTVAPWFVRALEELPPEIRAGYFRIIDREWFSLSDIYRYLQENGLTLSHRFLLFNGLINERTYSERLHSSLLGVDRYETPLEPIVWGDDKPARITESLSMISAEAIMQEILERASAVLDAPSLAVLSSLSARDIEALRIVGQPYFDLLELSYDPLYVGSTADFSDRFVGEAVNYWHHICEYLVSHYPSVAQRPTKLAVVLGNLPEPIRDSRRFVSIAVNVGQAVAEEALPGGTTAGAILRRATDRNLSLRFLFVSDTEELRRIRSVIPGRSWIARPRSSNARQLHSG